MCQEFGPNKTFSRRIVRIIYSLNELSKLSVLRHKTFSENVLVPNFYKFQTLYDTQSSELKFDYGRFVEKLIPRLYAKRSLVLGDS